LFFSVAAAAAPLKNKGKLCQLCAVYKHATPSGVLADIHAYRD